jgi:Type I phosphodiesterase / nucleotide pyrophosphatase
MSRRAAAALALALCCVGAAQDTRRPGPSDSIAAPRLIVLIVVDQLASSVLESAWPHLGEGGFRRLAREGASYPRAAYDHSCSETGPGHASLATGATPSVHGIVGNEWLDADSGEIVGCADDAGKPLVPGGARGSSARRLLAPTIGDALRAAYGPGVRIATVSIKDRSAIFPAGAGGDYVVWFDRKASCGFVTSSAFVRPGADVSWLERLNALRPKEALEGFVWEKVAPQGAYADLGADDDPVEINVDGSRAFPHELRPDRFASANVFCEALCASPAGLDLVLGGARFLLREAGLGQDDVPDLLGISFSSTDLVGHLYGPESHEVRDMTLRTDALLAGFLADLDRLCPERYFLLLSADHGVGPIPEALVRRGQPAGRVNVDKLRSAIEGGLRAAYGPAPESRRYLRRTLDSDVLLDRPLLAEKGIPLAQAQDRAAAAALTAPGVAEAIALHRVFDGSLPPGAWYDLFRNAQLQSRSVDLLVVPKPHWLFGSNRANHGTPHDYDRRVPLFLMGPGIKRGHEGADDVAPGSGVVTIAAALGIPPPAAANHAPLADALAK